MSDNGVPNEVARLDGFEPPTTAFEARYSIQLSYGRPAGMVPAQPPTDNRTRSARYPLLERQEGQQEADAAHDDHP